MAGRRYMEQNRISSDYSPSSSQRSRGRQDEKEHNSFMSPLGKSFEQLNVFPSNSQSPQNSTRCFFPHSADVFNHMPRMIELLKEQNGGKKIHHYDLIISWHDSGQENDNFGSPIPQKKFCSRNDSNLSVPHESTPIGHREKPSRQDRLSRFDAPSSVEKELSYHSEITPFRCHICLQTYETSTDLRLHLKITHEVPVRHVAQNSHAVSKKSETKGTGKPVRGPQAAISVPATEEVGDSTDSSSWDTDDESSKDLTPATSSDESWDERAPDKPPATRTPRSTLKQAKNDISCPECGKGFKWPHQLRRHMASHSDDRPYSCQICPSTYKTSSAFVFHLKKRHKLRSEMALQSLHAVEEAARKKGTESTATRAPVQPFSCGLCSENYLLPDDLVKHVSTAHQAILPAGRQTTPPVVSTAGKDASDKADKTPVDSI